MSEPLKNITPDKPLGTRHVAVIIGCILAAVIAISMCLPLISRDKNPHVAYVFHQRLYPFYYQTNADAQTELLSSLGFPKYYKTCGLRTNRPLIVGTAAIVRNVAVSIAGAIKPGSVRVHWGDYPALNVLLTYSLWIAINIIFIGLAVFVCFRAFSPVIGEHASVLSSMMLCAAPIVILSVREIGEGSVQILLVAISVLFWRKVLTETVSFRQVLLSSSAIGFLFLGKFAITTFAAGCCICLFSSKRGLLGVIIPAAAAPMCIWIGLCDILGINFTVPEISANAAALRTMASPLCFQGIAQFSARWISVLAEDGLFLQAPFALWGLYRLMKSKHPLLRFIPIFVIVDFCFYYALGRTHAVYGLHTMIFYFPLVAVGITQISRWLSELLKNRIWENRIALLITLTLQTALIAVIAPRYGG